MALDPRDITLLSQLLDQALELTPAERVAWLAALPPEHQRHAEALREMLAREADLDTDDRLAVMPRLPPGDESVAHAGDRVGPYALLREIGRGGMGSVWLAARADGSFKRQVALKLPRLAWGTGLAERMAREREIGALLEHPNIARLYDAGVDERGRPYLALEYIDGQPIDAWCESQGLSVRDRLRLFVQVARAVAYAHGRLVVHRDLKPSNVMVTPDGQAHLLDFGIAKLLTDAATPEAGLTQQQGRMLTPHYASPEQVAGEAITVQSDVYSLGVLLYELLTNTLPIAPKRSTLGAVEEAILEGDAPMASSRVKDRSTAKALRGEVDAILGKAMQREPGRRYATADAMAQDIERHLNGETVAARPDSMAYRLRKGLRRHWVGVSAVTAVMVALLTGSGVAVVQAQRAARSAERERVVKEFVADVFKVNSRTDPRNAALRPSSTQALLEGGAQLIQQRFAGQPDIQAELFGMVGGVFSDMGAYRLASDYATRRVEALATLRANPEEQTQGLLALAQALFDDRRYGDAEPRVRRALEQAGRGTRARSAGLVLLARVQAAQSRKDALAETLNELKAEVDSQGSEPSSARAWALFLEARAMSDRNELDLAMPAFARAIDMALLSEGPTSPDAVTFRLSLAVRLASTNHAELAQSHFDAATKVLRSLGGAHEVRAAFAAAAFAARRYLAFSQITAAHALATVEQNKVWLQNSSLPVPDWFVPQIDFWRGEILVTTGDIAAGFPLLESAEPTLRRFSATLDDRRILASALGKAAMYAGRHELADKLHRERLEIRRQQGDGNHPWATFDYTRVAANLLMEGRTRDAASALDQAPSFDPIRGEGLSEDRYRRVLENARALVDLADGNAAAALFRLKRSTPSERDGDNDWLLYNAALGEALCASGQYAEGLALIKKAMLAEEEQSFRHAPWLARMRGHSGLCAAGLGDRATALRFATLARADFTAQSGVSPYYKAPLIQLERKLGLKLPPP
jgi:tetratricopeptide (TPR) repeat protein